MPGPPKPHVPLPLPDTGALDRRLRWRVGPIVVFAGLMALLAGLAAGSLMCPRRITAGLPDDPDLAAARARLAGVPVRTGDLRFGSTLFGDVAPDHSFGPSDQRAVAAAESLVERAAARHALDARLWAARGALDLAVHRFARAERRYRRALDLAPHYPEARLGLGVALALQARIAPEPVARRRLALAAIAQFAAVGADDPYALEALYGRALMLREADRAREAEEARRAYLARDPVSPWAARLRAAE
uniref:Tetratricopeptide repeat protein n=1 Tax=Eiseniibacteriota bacterium TaxID=2212470 RepID=A0A832I372_UNCEI